MTLRRGLGIGRESITHRIGQRWQHPGLGAPEFCFRRQPVVIPGGIAQDPDALVAAVCGGFAQGGENESVRGRGDLIEVQFALANDPPGQAFDDIGMRHRAPHQRMRGFVRIGHAAGYTGRAGLVQTRLLCALPGDRRCLHPAA